MLHSHLVILSPRQLFQGEEIITPDNDTTSAKSSSIQNGSQEQDTVSPQGLDSIVLAYSVDYSCSQVGKAEVNDSSSSCSLRGVTVYHSVSCSGSDRGRAMICAGLVPTGNAVTALWLVLFLFCPPQVSSFYCFDLTSCCQGSGCARHAVSHSLSPSAAGVRSRKRCISA